MNFGTDSAFAARGHVQVLAVVPLVEGHPVDAELVPHDIGVVLPARRQLEHLGEPCTDALRENGILALGQRALLVLLLDLRQLRTELRWVALFFDPGIMAPQLLLGHRLFELPFDPRLVLQVLLLLALLLLDRIAAANLDLPLDGGHALDEAGASTPCPSACAGARRR